MQVLQNENQAFLLTIKKINLNNYWATCGKPSHKTGMFFHRRRRLDQLSIPQFLESSTKTSSWLIHTKIRYRVCFETRGRIPNHRTSKFILELKTNKKAAIWGIRKAFLKEQIFVRLHECFIAL